MMRIRCGSSRSGRCRAAILGALLSFAVSGSAHAIALGLTVVPPTPGSVFIGNSIFVEVSLSGLAAGSAPSLTAFDLDLGFDDALLDFVDLAFAAMPGTTCTPSTFFVGCEAYVDFSSSTGVVSFDGASLLSPSEVNTIQPASGPIATIEFLAKNAGTASFSFSSVDLVGTTCDPAPSPCASTTEGPLAASIAPLDVSIDAVPIPEPGTGLLVMLGLVGLRFAPRPQRT